jgi:integrase
MRHRDGRGVEPEIELLVLRTPVRAVMELMGWTTASMASRYMHVPDEIKEGIAGQMGNLLWSPPDDRREAG